MHKNCHMGLVKTYSGILYLYITIIICFREAATVLVVNTR